MKRIVLILALAAGMLVAPWSLAQTTTFRSTMSGPSEATPNASPGAGIATITLDETDPLAPMLQLSVPFFDLLGATTAAHIHCCTVDPLTGNAGVATMVPTFTGFPTGVHEGQYDHVFSLADASTYNPAFITANGGTVALAMAALLDGMRSNASYLNIHTNVYPGGEIRGFLVAVPVPEPGSWAMLAVGLAGLAFVARKRA